MKTFKLFGLGIFIVGSGCISLPLMLTSCSKTLVVKLVQENYETYGDYSTNLYKITFGHNIDKVVNTLPYDPTLDNYAFDTLWHYEYTYFEGEIEKTSIATHNNVYWIDGKTLYYENLPDRNSFAQNNWSQHIIVKLTDYSTETFWTYGTTIYYY